MSKKKIENSSLQGHLSADAVKARKVALPLLQNPLEVVRQRNTAKKKTLAMPSGEEAQGDASSPPHRVPKTKKSNVAGETSDLTDLSGKITLAFPSSAYVHSDFTKVRKESKKLYFEEDQLLLHNMGALKIAEEKYQATFLKDAFMIDFVEEAAKRDEAHTGERAKWTAARNDFTTREESSTKKQAELEAMIVAKDLAARKAALETLEYKKQVDDFEGQLLGARAKTMIRTYADAARRYEECLPGPWDVSGYKRDLEAYEKMQRGEGGYTSSPPADD